MAREDSAGGAEEPLCFGPFRLEVAAHQLWRGTEKLALRLLPTRVLTYLVRRPGRLVGTDELLEALWAGTRVSRAVIRVCIREIRKALGDEATAPRYIETIGRQGYRFIAPLSTPPPQVFGSRFVVSSLDHSGSTATINASRQKTGNEKPATLLVGREEESRRLQAWLEKAGTGQRQLVFVTGEAGIGKTTLVDHFLDHIQTREPVGIGRGQCIQHYGAGEAYLPVLEALGRLAQGPSRGQLLSVLWRTAPSWLVQLPALVTEGELEALQRKIQGVPRERMLREFADALEALTEEWPLVLVFDDLHWSDAATVELLAFLARRREPARLLVIGAYRPADVIAHQQPLHGLVRELRAHGQCTELRLELLTADDVQTYVSHRLGEEGVPPDLSQVIYRRTDGNALFMVNFVDSLLGHGLLTQVGGRWVLPRGLTAVEANVPETLQELLLQQLEALAPEEQRVLEVASVEGVRFTAAAVAVGLAGDQQAVEAVCEGLSRRGQVVQAGSLEEWPDGTFTASYQFCHALYQNVLYERQGEMQRVRAHRLLGERKAAGYGERGREIAAELAVHFERARVAQQAAQYRQAAAEQALRRSAYREASDHCTKGLALLERTPETLERAQQGLGFLMTLGVVQIATKGYAAAEVEQTYLRARALCDQVGEPQQRCSVLYGLWNFYGVRSDLRTAYGLAEQLFDTADRTDDSALQLVAHWTQGLSHSWYGHLIPARKHLEQVLALYNPGEHGPLIARYGQDAKVTALSYGALILWLSGYPDQARQRSEEALALGQELGIPFNVAYALSNATLVHQFCQEVQQTRERADSTIAFATEHGFPHMKHWGGVLQGWALAAQGQGEVGISLLRQGLTALTALGVRLGRPHLLALLVDAYKQAGQIEECFPTLAEALAQVQETGEQYFEAELYRLKGELALQQSSVQSPGSRVHIQQKVKGKISRQASVPRYPSPTPSTQEAEECFLKAIATARQQEAKSLELRAAMSLARLWQQQGKKKEARELLTGIYGWFTEGFDTRDLREAKALLDALQT